MTAENGFPNYKEHPVKMVEAPAPRVELFQNPPQTILNEPEEMTAPGEWQGYDEEIADLTDELPPKAEPVNPAPTFHDLAQEEETILIIKTAGDDPARWALQFCALIERQGFKAPPVPFVQGWFAEAMGAVRREPNAERERVSYESGYEAGVADERGAHEAKTAQNRVPALAELYGSNSVTLPMLELGRVLAVSWANMRGVGLDQIQGLDWPHGWDEQDKSAVRSYLAARA